MPTKSEVAVTLSADLFQRLSREARRIGLPLEWLVASLVADMMDETTETQLPAVA